MMKAYAYVNDDGSIEVDSVASSERAVMVNMIVIASYGNVWPMNDWPDDAMKRNFINATGGKGSVKEVGVYVQKTIDDINAEIQDMVDNFNVKVEVTNIPPFRDRDL
jgi:hypothetical protein